MTTTAQTITIGNVLRADIRGFVVASRIPEPDVPTFGTFVSAPIQQGHAVVIGLVYNISLQDDPFLRNLAATVKPGDPRSEEIIKDQRENRVIPVEIAVASVGYRLNETSTYLYGFPPQPPMVLNSITVCDEDAIKSITSSPDFLRTLLDNREIPTDELIPAALLRAARLRPEARPGFLLSAGRYLARPRLTPVEPGHSPRVREGGSKQKAGAQPLGRAPAALSRATTLRRPHYPGRPSCTAATNATARRCNSAISPESSNF